VLFKKALKSYQSRKQKMKNISRNFFSSSRRKKNQLILHGTLKKQKKINDAKNKNARIENKKWSQKRNLKNVLLR